MLLIKFREGIIWPIQKTLLEPIGEFSNASDLFEILWQ
jgi:hypothetical protein